MRPWTGGQPRSLLGAGQRTLERPLDCMRLRSDVADTRHLAFLGTTVGFRHQRRRGAHSVVADDTALTRPTGINDSKHTTGKRSYVLAQVNSADDAAMKVVPGDTRPSAHGALNRANVEVLALVSTVLLVTAYFQQLSRFDWTELPENEHRFETPRRAFVALMIVKVALVGARMRAGRTPVLLVNMVSRLTNVSGEINPLALTFVHRASQLSLRSHISPQRCALVSHTCLPSCSALRYNRSAV